MYACMHASMNACMHVFVISVRYVCMHASMYACPSTSPSTRLEIGGFGSSEASSMHVCVIFVKYVCMCMYICMYA